MEFDRKLLKSNPKPAAASSPRDLVILPLLPARHIPNPFIYTYTYNVYNIRPKRWGISISEKKSNTKVFWCASKRIEKFTFNSGADLFSYSLSARFTRNIRYISVLYRSMSTIQNKVVQDTHRLCQKNPLPYCAGKVESSKRLEFRRSQFGYNIQDPALSIRVRRTKRMSGWGTKEEKQSVCWEIYRNRYNICLGFWRVRLVLISWTNSFCTNISDIERTIHFKNAGNRDILSNAFHRWSNNIILIYTETLVKIHRL